MKVPDYLGDGLTVRQPILRLDAFTRTRGGLSQTCRTRLSPWFWCQTNRVFYARTAAEVLALDILHDNGGRHVTRATVEHHLGRLSAHRAGRCWRCQAAAKADPDRVWRCLRAG